MHKNQDVVIWYHSTEIKLLDMREVIHVMLSQPDIDSIDRTENDVDISK